MNTATPGLVGYALADRASAVQLWEPAYTTLHAKLPTARLLDLKIKESWKEFVGGTNIPYLGVAAHLDHGQGGKAHDEGEDDERRDDDQRGAEARHLP